MTRVRIIAFIVVIVLSKLVAVQPICWEHIATAIGNGEAKNAAVVVEIFHANRVQPLAESHFAGKLKGRMLFVVVNYQTAVDGEHAAIIAQE